MTNRKSQKLNGKMIQYTESYKIITIDDKEESIKNQKQLNDAQLEAQKLIQNSLLQVEQTINQAEQEASQILEEAKKDAVRIQTQAQETGQSLGYEEGYEAGFNKAVEESTTIIESAETILKGAYQGQKEILMNTEKEMLKLVISIANRVINRAFKYQPELVLSLIENAVRSLKDHEEVKIFINPENYQLLESSSDYLKQKINGLEVIKLIEDPTVSYGGVIVESVSSKVDAQLETQLDEIYNRLMDEAQMNPQKIDPAMINQQKRMQQQAAQTTIEQQKQQANAEIQSDMNPNPISDNV